MKTNAGYRADIDGLRALAVGAVVAFHYFPSALTGGFIGVDVFFVISGYLITHALEGDPPLLDFYARRARRILPALIVTLVVALCLGSEFASLSQLQQLGKHVLGGATFTSNLVLGKEAGYFDTASERKPLLHLWSLAVEEQFYLVWPVLMFALRRRWVALLGVASFAVNLWLVSHFNPWAFYLLPTRFWELLAGCLLATAPTMKKHTQLASTAAALCLAGAAIFFDGAANYPGWRALVPVAGSVLFIAAGPQGWLNRVVSLRPFVAIGLISYPLYLLHWPLLVFMRIAGAEGMEWPLIATSVLCATLIYVGIEKPIRASAFVPKRAIIAGAVALAVMMLAGGYAMSARWVPANERDRIALSNYAHYAGKWNQACFAGVPTDGPEHFTANCVPPDAKILLWGDSLSANLAVGWRSLAAERGITIAELEGSLCPPVMGIDQKDRPRCREINDFVWTQLATLRPQIVVLTANWSVDAWNSGFLEALQETITQLKTKFGVQTVIVVGGFPYWREPLYDTLEHHYVAQGLAIPKRIPLAMRNGVFDAEQMTEQTAVLAGATFVSTITYFCNENGCLTTVGSDLSTDLVSIDEVHLSDAAARHVFDARVAPVVREALH